MGACGGGDVSLPPDGQPASIAVMEGNDQSGRVGEPLADPLVVQVTDSRGRPVEGATVVFEFSSAGPGASVVPEEKITNGDGLADTRLVLGTVIGRQTGQARVVTGEGSTPLLASFAAVALSENANSMAAAAGQDQTGHVGLALDDRLVVEVTDGFGNPVAGVPITWEAAGGGSVSETVVETDEDGRSRVERTLGPTVGQQTTLASSEGLAGSPVIFVHTAVAGDASRLTVEAGNDQTGEVGTLLPADLVVRLVDSEGNGVPNTAVTWVAATGGGSVDPQNTTTDGEGRASTRWTLGATLGEQRADAVVSGVGVASFRATATAAAPPALSISTQPSATARNGVPLERQPVIQLSDGQGNPVTTAGVQVTAALGGGGELEGTVRRNTDGSGRASFDDLSISGAPGTRTLVFSAPGYAQVTSNEVQLQVIGTSTAITADLPDPSEVGTAFTVRFQVTSQGTTPQGTVTVSDGVQSCTGSLANGAGSCPLTLTNVGVRTLTATFAGEPGLASSSDSELHTVTAAAPPPPAATTTTITSDEPDPSISGSSVRVVVSVVSSGGTPTGNVSVTVSGSTATCTVALSGGEGTCDLTLDAVGPRILTATYLGGSGFAGSSDTEGHTVTAQPPPPPTNQSPTAGFTADCDELVCRFEDESDDLDGSIEDYLWDFGDGATSDDREPRHEYDNTGTYTVRLTVTDNDGAPATVTHTVTVSEDAASTNTRFEVDDPDPTIPGQSFTVTLSVRSADGTPEGTATVSDAVDGCVVQIVGGVGSCTLALNTVGDRTLTAIYQGNSSFAASSATEEHTVNPPPPAGTTTNITGDSPEPSDPGAAITVSFTVSSSGGTPTGTVVVTDENGGGCNGSAPSGSCSYTPSGTGTRTITATYQGNASFTESSDTEEHTVTTPPPPPAGTSTSITGVDPEPSDPGTEITVSFTVSSSGGTPTGTVVVTDENGGGCNGSAPSGSCSYTPSGTGTRTITATYQGNPSFTESSDTEQHIVTSPPANAAPVAIIGSIICTGLNCTFTDASNDPDGNATITEWSWVFGDDAGSNEPNSTHAYSAPGDYSATLTVTDNGGLSSTASETVHVLFEGDGQG